MKSTGSFFSFAKEIASKKSPCRVGVTDCRDDKIVSTINLNAPGNSACGETYRTLRRPHTQGMQVRFTAIRRHLPAASSGIAYREIVKTKFVPRHADPVIETAVPIVRHDVIVR